MDSDADLSRVDYCVALEDAPRTSMHEMQMEAVSPGKIARACEVPSMISILKPLKNDDENRSCTI